MNANSDPNPVRVGRHAVATTPLRATARPRHAPACARIPAWARALVMLATCGISATSVAALPTLPPDDPHWKDTCAHVAALQPPAIDMPGQGPSPARCDAVALYDGVSGTPNYAAARTCAFTQLTTHRDDALGPAAVLTMLYANGLNVRADQSPAA